MIAYVQGKVTFKSPAYFIIECGGIGYQVNISLNTYSRVQDKDSCKLYTYLHIKEDAHTLYGFAEEAEKELFSHLISVSGIGPALGRMILSSYTPEEIRKAIIQEDEFLIKSIKGIGPKSAKRIILELKDKLIKDAREPEIISGSSGNTFRGEALSALIMLGFAKPVASKAVDEILKTDKDISSVEELIKKALKKL